MPGSSEPGSASGPFLLYPPARRLRPTLRAKAGGIQRRGRWNRGESERRAQERQQLRRQLLRPLAGLTDRWCLCRLLQAQISPSPPFLHPSEEPQPGPQAFSNNSAVDFYMKMKKPARKRSLRTETRPAPPRPRRGPLRQHRPFDDPPVLVDGEVVVARVVQALLNPRVQVLGGDERFGFLLNEGQGPALNAR